MIRRNHATLTFSEDPFRGILVALGWSDVAEPDRFPVAHPRVQDALPDNVVPLRAARPALVSATTITRVDPDHEPATSDI